MVLSDQTRTPSLARSFRAALGAAGDVVAHTRPTNGKKQPRGFALLTVTVTVAILSALSVQFSYSTRTNVWMASNLEASVQAYFNARSATKIALLAVNAKKNMPEVQKFLGMLGGGSSGTSRIEIWQRACDFVDIFAKGTFEFFGTPLLDFSREKAVGAPNGLPVKMADGTKAPPAFKCKVMAEDGRVNLNRASTEPLVVDPSLSGGSGGGSSAQLTDQQLQQQQRSAVQLYVQLGGLFKEMVGNQFESEDEAIDLIMNIIDWTDADTAGSDIDPQGNYTIGGAEPDYGRYGYESKDAKMDTVGEVQLVEGMDSDVYCKIRDKLTVFSTDKVNVNDADLGVLKGILCQSLPDDTTRAALCMPLVPGVPPPIDNALMALDLCREMKKQIYSTPFTSFKKFTDFFDTFPTAMNTGVPLPFTPSILSQQVGTKTKMVRIEAEGIFDDTKRKMVTIVDVTSGSLVHFHYE